MIKERDERENKIPINDTQQGNFKIRNRKIKKQVRACLFFWYFFVLRNAKRKRKERGKKKRKENKKTYKHSGVRAY